MFSVDRISYKVIDCKQRIFMLIVIHRFAV